MAEQGARKGERVIIIDVATGHGIASMGGADGGVDGTRDEGGPGYFCRTVVSRQTTDLVGLIRLVFPPTPSSPINTHRNPTLVSSLTAATMNDLKWDPNCAP